MITVRRVSKRYGGVLALDDVSLDVAHGTTHVLLGPSGFRNLLAFVHGKQTHPRL